MPLPNPVIFVPGVTASYLRDLYPLPPETLWSVLRKDFDRAKMHPDNTVYEAQQPAMVRPDQLYEIAYEELVEELRYNLSPAHDQPVPVYPFGYDWRQALHVTEAILADFIDEVIERTRLMRHYHPRFAANPKVNLVGHSMGGLVIAGYVEKFGGAKVDKVVTLATPYNGSFEAMVKMATGTADIGGGTPSSREREASRVTPALYHLLPDFDTGISVPDGSGLPHSTFKRRLWQESIVQTVREYVQRYSVTTTRVKSRGNRLFDQLLGTAGDHRQRTQKMKLEDKGLTTRDWLCVVGTGAETRVRMEVRIDRKDQPEFVLTSRDRLNHWGHSDQERAKMTGDGTVHFKGALPGFLPYESLVCVTPQDYGYWEIQDRLVSAKAGFHGILPNMNMLHRLIVRFFTGATDPRGNTWGRPPPGVSKSDWIAATPMKLAFRNPVDG